MTAGKRGRPAIPVGEHGAFLPKKSGTSWHCRVRYRDSDGVRREFTASGRTKQECLDDAARRWIEIRNGLESARGRAETSMRVVALKWLDSVGVQVHNGQTKPGTLKQYRACWQGTLAPVLDHLDVNELTRAQVQDLLYEGLFRRDRHGEHILDSDGQRIPLVGKQARQVLGAVLNFAADRGYRHDGMSPLFGTKPPPRRPRGARIERVLTEAEWDELIDLARAAGRRPRAAPHLYRVLIIMYFTGVRIGEAVGLTHAKVDLHAEPPRVTFDEQLPESYRVGDVDPLEPTKGTDRRTVVMAPELFELLVDIASSSPHRGAKDPVIATRRGTFVTHANVRTMLRDLVQGTHLDWVHPHSLRRTYLTSAEVAFGMEGARVLGGHRDKQTTGLYVIKDEIEVLDPRPMFARRGEASGN